MSEKLNKCVMELVRDVVRECGSLYNFDAEEALGRLSLQKKKMDTSSKEQSLEQDKKKGRPKKSKKVFEVQGEDLFAELMAAATEEVAAVPVVETCHVVETCPVVETSSQQEEEVKSVSSEGDVTPKMKRAPKKPAVKVSKESKEAEKAAKEAEKAAEKAAKEAEKAAKEAEKKAAKEAEKAAKEAEKKAAKEAEKTTKAAEKKTEKKEAKKTKKTETEILEKKLEEEMKKVEKELEEELVEEEVEEEEEEEEEEADVVKKFEFEGVKYLKSKKTGIIYNMDQEVVGKWNEKTQKIDFDEDEDSSDDEE